MKQHLSSVAALFTSVVLAACSSGGSSTPGPSPSPPPPPPPASTTIQVLPASFDFGKVTAGNTPAPLEVTIRNSGNAALTVSAISFLAPASQSFILNPSGGAKPCASVSPTVAVGDTCTVHIVFQPSSAGTHSSTLQISSNASNAAVVSLPVAGSSEAVTALVVRINQLDTSQLSTGACPTPRTTAYVSVTDQGGYPVVGLQSVPGAFSVAQGSGATPLTLIPPISFVGSGVYKNVAISAVLDHSGSLTDQPVAFADMKAGFTSLLAGLKSGDIAEVIKFATEYEVVQVFTPNKADLTAAIAAPFNKGRTTLLYDTVHKAVTDTALQANYRRAVIVATDGIDEGNTVGVPLSTNTVDTVIAHALLNKVPIFAIGIGASVNSSDLQKMASDTGGLYYQANASQNLATIYQQLASLLYENQYVLTFDRIVTGTAQSPISVTARSGSVSGNAARAITACP